MEQHADERIRDHVYLLLLNCIAPRVIRMLVLMSATETMSVSVIAIRISASNSHSTSVPTAIGKPGRLLPKGPRNRRQSVGGRWRRTQSTTAVIGHDESVGAQFGSLYHISGIHGPFDGQRPSHCFRMHAICRSAHPYRLSSSS